MRSRISCMLILLSERASACGSRDVFTRASERASEREKEMKIKRESAGSNRKRKQKIEKKKASDGPSLTIKKRNSSLSLFRRLGRSPLAVHAAPAPVRAPAGAGQQARRLAAAAARAAVRHRNWHFDIFGTIINIIIICPASRLALHSRQTLFILDDHG